MTPIRLPLLATHRTKYIWGVFISIFCYGAYTITNHLTLFTPTVLPFTAFEKALPILPWTMWPYLTSFFFMVIVFFDVRNLENLSRLAYAFLTLQVVANLIFIFFPVSIPRDLYPLPADIGPVEKWMFNYIRTVDSTINCLPSLHVADCCLIGLVYLKENRGKFVFAMLWVALVSFSTLGTKQHYLWDVIGGIVIAIVIFALAFSRYLVIVPSKKMALAAQK
ncbi:MAG TPA: phosphatase PAP2 family protein [Opitutaceae bacterium]|nr:phosphatase PAP2 family protein [Opitutaceae bacterium]